VENRNLVIDVQARLDRPGLCMRTGCWLPGW
jgi:hypothetical protein